MSTLTEAKLREYEMSESQTERSIFLMRMARTHEGFTIYMKSPEFCEYFKTISTDKISIRGWGSDTNISCYDINNLYAQPTFDQGGSIQNWTDPNDYVPKTLVTALKFWGSDTLIWQPNFNVKVSDLNNEVVHKGTPNLALLLADKLGDGFSYNMPTPVSNRMFDVYYQSCKQYLAWIYDNFVVPRRAEFRLEPVEEV